MATLRTQRWDSPALTGSEFPSIPWLPPSFLRIGGTVTGSLEGLWDGEAQLGGAWVKVSP